MRARLFAVLALIALAAPVARAATITIVNNDGAGEGFNDPTAVAPVGGNPGVTRGQQRLNVFQHAANIWGSILPSNVTILVRAQFNSQTCTATSAVLGSAGPRTVHANFPGAPVANTWYHQALANKLAGVDLDAGFEDINATFNSQLDDSPTCLGGADWYYGYDNNEGTNVDLLPVVLHEIGHGLGFSTLVSGSTGTLFNGMPDIYCRHLYDRTVGLTWDNMTDGQRQASAINTGNLVWTGGSANIQGQLFLQNRPEMTVTSPPALAGVYAIGTAAFGQQLSTTPLTGQVVQVTDAGGASTTDGCDTPIPNVSGKIALVDRGNCTFVIKAANLQAAGAIGVILVNNTAATTPPGMSGNDPSVTIPMVSVTQAVGNQIKAQLALPAVVNASIGLNPNFYAGQSNEYQMLMYAPNPLESGSSVSHWDVSARPNLLMEPAINTDLGSGVDLTRYHFEDIGWMAQTLAVGDGIESGVTLHPAVPNPMERSATLRFDLAKPGRVALEVFDASGRRVRELLRGDLGAGTHLTRWDGADDDTRRLPAGIYHVRLDAAGVSRSHTVVLLD